MRNGFIYEIVNTFLNSLKYLNLVELFKLIGQKLNPDINDVELSIICSRISTDIFIVLKWLLILILIIFQFSSWWLSIVIWYLLITNLYTYFFYHIWSFKILTDNYYTVDRIKRRFINLFQAILYSIFGFSYLYYLPFSNEYSWVNNAPTYLHSLIFSLSNSFTYSYDFVKPLTDVGHNIALIQLLMIFIFITIIISTSIPQTQNKEE